ncbi:PhnD/SsuA/transferrin family substrate-binding protein [Nodularia chucula]|uniref:PhnD/SsuA/transferrin family substrate-binding protein n=1 Tax=Nodularia chucula TaxID=3093667 RepID=UPI0039C7088E
MKRRKLLSNFLLFIGGFITGCNSLNNTSNELRKYTSKSLKLAVADALGLEALEAGYGDFRTALAEVLGIPIEFFPGENRTDAAAALRYGQVDIILAGPSEYVVLHSRAKAIPLIAIERHDYYPTIVVRSNSNIKTLDQLKGKTIAMLRVGSTSGHLAPIKMLIDAGLDPNSDVKIVMLGNAGIESLKKGEVDAWTVASDRYQTILDNYSFSESDFSILAKGNLLPSDLFVINNQWPDRMIRTVRSLMLEHQDQLIQSLIASTANQPYQGSKFIAANDADYNIIREVYQEIGQGSFLE